MLHVYEQHLFPAMDLLTSADRQRLLANGRIRDRDHAPVVKLFTPDANATWLLSEISPSEPNIAFGLCDLGMGFPELGNVDLNEIGEITGRYGLPVEREEHFEGRYPMSVYAAAARSADRIVTDAASLEAAAAKISARGRGR